jgi:hypothetical protein
MPGDQIPYSVLPSAEMGTAPLQFNTMTMTYSELLDYFTPEELDDAAIIARFEQHHFPHLTYGEVYVRILKEMWATTH